VSFTNSPESSSKTSASAGSLEVAAADLIKLARAALQEKRIRDCLALTDVILKIDPGNKEAEVLQSWIRSDLAQQFQAVLERANEARAHGDMAKWGTVRTSLRRLLNVLPDHEGAKALLLEAQNALSHFEPNSPAMSMPPLDPKPTKQSRRALFIGAIMLLVVAAFGYWTFNQIQGSSAGTPGASSENENYGTLALELEEGVQVFVDGQDRGTAPLQPLRLPAGRHRLTYKSAGVPIDEEDVQILSDQTETNKAGRTLGRIDLVVVPGSGVELTIDNEKIGHPPDFMFLKPGLHELSLTAEGYETQIRKVLVVAGQRSLVPVLLQGARAAESNTSQAAPKAAANTERSNPPAARPVRNQPNPPTGKLAVTASRRVQVYSGERYLGSTPVVLELPPGLQTLEYRYDTARQRITHFVRSNETTEVSIATDIVVKINAQPWADVFVQDGQIGSLGQTPLNDVRVPVGGLLVFRNPKFPDKTYRVRPEDTTIAVTFP
jgi:hypothetical protein